MEWLEIVLSILTGLAATIPLVISLVKWIEKAIRAKQWVKLLNFVMELMADAEKELPDGASRKEWVLQMVESSSDIIDYEVDMDEVSKLIDALCEMTKKINVKKNEE